jgi:hypothetical protein
MKESDEINKLLKVKCPRKIFSRVSFDFWTSVFQFIALHLSSFSVFGLPLKRQHLYGLAYVGKRDYVLTSRASKQIVKSKLVFTTPLSPTKQSDT